MRKLRDKTENLEALLKEQKIGDDAICDTVTGFDIIKVPYGWIYKHEYAGLCYVPDVQKERKLEAKTVTK